MIYLYLFITFFEIGLFGFGGGYGMLSLIQGEVVHHWHWMTTGEFTDIVAISQMTPGPIGINSATYIGYVATGGNVLGSLLATLVVVLPSFLLVLFTAHLIHRHRDSVFIKGMFLGLRPVVVGLIASAALLLMNRDNFSDYTWSIGICVATFCFVHFTKLHPIYAIILAGIAGYLIY